MACAWLYVTPNSLWCLQDVHGVLAKAVKRAVAMKQKREQQHGSNGAAIDSKPANKFNSPMPRL